MLYESCLSRRTKSCMTKSRSTLVFTNLPSICSQSYFFGWCIFCLVLFCTLNYMKVNMIFYPGPRGFSWFFFAKENNSKPRSGDEEREKNLWLLWPRISLSCRRQGQDLTLGRWLVDSFSNTQTNLIGSFNCNYRGDAEDFHTSFCLSLLGKKIVCMLHSQ